MGESFVLTPIERFDRLPRSLVSELHLVNRVEYPVQYEFIIVSADSI